MCSKTSGCLVLWLGEVENNCCVCVWLSINHNNNFVWSPQFDAFRPQFMKSKKQLFFIAEFYCHRQTPFHKLPVGNLFQTTPSPNVSIKITAPILFRSSMPNNQLNSSHFSSLTSTPKPTQQIPTALVSVPSHLHPSTLQFQQKSLLPFSFVHMHLKPTQHIPTAPKTNSTDPHCSCFSSLTFVPLTNFYS